jgi:hypothetical protein
MTLNLDLPDHWFFTFYPNPDIRVNFGDPVTGETGATFFRSMGWSGGT